MPLSSGCSSTNWITPSVLQATEFMNGTDNLEHDGIKAFNAKTLYRAMELLGRNRERIVRELQDCVLELLVRQHTDVLLDWTSIVYYGDMAKLAKYGYSRDHHPGERQQTLRAAQPALPFDLPISLTIETGNVNDQAYI